MRSKIREIMDKCESPVQLPEKKGYSNGKEWAIDQLLSLFSSEMMKIVKEAKPKRFIAKNLDVDVSHYPNAQIALDQYESNLTQKLAKLMEG